MTNVPEPVRAIWTDLYKLFDKYYRMDGSEEAWIAFWTDAQKVWEGSRFSSRIGDACCLVADCIGDRLKQAESIEKQHQLRWSEE